MSTDMGIDRRQLLKGLAAGTATAAGAAVAASGPSVLRAAAIRPRRRRWGRFVERQETGAEIWQVTTEEFLQSNIYCELPYCSADSRYFIYERWHPEPKRRGLNRTDFMIVRLGTWEQRLLVTGENTEGCAISPDGRWFYCVRCPYWPQMELWRVELPAGKPEKVHEFSRGVWSGSRGTVSADGRYYARLKRFYDERTCGIILVDLRSGEEKVLDKDPYIWNPHPQFKPTGHDRLMVQWNRGEGFIWAKGEKPYTPPYEGPKGTTLYLLSVPDARRIPLKIGPPHTPPTTGHEAWSRATGEVLVTLLTGTRRAREQGNLYAVREGGEPRVVARGYVFGHLGVSRCGRLFCCDDWGGANRIVIGSVQTGRTAVVCYPKNKGKFGQRSHAHPYLTPDLKWVIFNSDRDGSPHVYAATVPPRLIETVVRQ